MTFPEWEERHRQEILELKRFCVTKQSDDPVALLEQLRVALVNMGRAGFLANAAKGFYRMALRSNWPDEGQAELRKKTAEAESAHVELVWDDLNWVKHQLKDYVEVGRSALATMREERRGASLA